MSSGGKGPTKCLFQPKRPARLPPVAYLVLHDREVPLKALVTMKQGLGANEVFAVVLRGDLRLLLLDPLDGFSHVPARQPHESRQRKWQAFQSKQHTQQRPPWLTQLAVALNSYSLAKSNVVFAFNGFHWDVAAWALSGHWACRYSSHAWVSSYCLSSSLSTSHPHPVPGTRPLSAALPSLIHQCWFYCSELQSSHTWLGVGHGCLNSTPPCCLKGKHMIYFGLRGWPLIANSSQRLAQVQAWWSYSVSRNVLAKSIPSESLEVCSAGQRFLSLQSQIQETLPGGVHLMLLQLDQGQLGMVLLQEETRAGVRQRWAYFKNHWTHFISHWFLPCQAWRMTV